MKLKMQPTIHLQSRPGYYRRPYPGLLCKCIVGCIFNSVVKYPVLKLGKDNGEILIPLL
jgi:hypothetical protein